MAPSVQQQGVWSIPQEQRRLLLGVGALPSCAPCWFCLWCSIRMKSLHWSDATLSASRIVHGWQRTYTASLCSSSTRLVLLCTLCALILQLHPLPQLMPLQRGH